MMLALFLINAVLIASAAFVGYLVGQLHERQSPKKTYYFPQDEHKEVLPERRKPVMTPIAADDVSSPISTITSPTAEELELRNRPQKVKDGDDAMSATLDKIFADQASEQNGDDWGDDDV